jgi:thiaminase/transcriptional activator TenA
MVVTRGSNDALDAIFPPGGLLARLRAANADDWEAYTRHGFVRGMGDGTLPEPCFRHYLIQDYLFLIHFARAYALAGYKAETLEELRAATRTAMAISDTEMGLHVTYCAERGISEADMRAAPEGVATMAYTRYVMERGMAGDLLDLYAALAPCVLGYAEIGLALGADPATRREGNPYDSWIEMYSGADYQDVARRTAAFIEDLAKRRGAEARLASLTRTFGEATRLEVAFWQQGLDGGT